MEETIGLMKHMSHKEREQVEVGLEVSFEDVFDAMELAWANVRELQSDLRTLIYGEGIDTRSEVEKNYQLYRDRAKRRC